MASKSCCNSRSVFLSEVREGRKVFGPIGPFIEREGLTIAKVRRACLKVFQNRNRIYIQPMGVNQ